MRPAVTGDVRPELWGLGADARCRQARWLPGREKVGVAGHKMGPKRVREARNWVAGHKKGLKRAREVNNWGAGHERGSKCAWEVVAGAERGLVLLAGVGGEVSRVGSTPAGLRG